MQNCILSFTKIAKVEYTSGKLVWLLLLRRILSSTKVRKMAAQAKFIRAQLICKRKSSRTANTHVAHFPKRLPSVLENFTPSQPPFPFPESAN